MSYIIVIQCECYVRRGSGTGNNLPWPALASLVGMGVPPPLDVQQAMLVEYLNRMATTVAFDDGETFSTSREVLGVNYDAQYLFDIFFS